MEILNQFQPFEPHGTHDVLLAVKYNIFECGGVAVGVCVSHRIVDGASATTFLGAWSATSRGDEDHVCPKFDAATNFPPKDISWGKGDIGVTKEKIVARRLVFDKSSIAALKENASSTRVLAVSAFIWKRLMEISKSKPAPARVHVAIHAVNFRTYARGWSHPGADSGSPMAWAGNLLPRMPPAGARDQDFKFK